MKFVDGVFTFNLLEEGKDFHITDRWRKKYHFKIGAIPAPAGFGLQAIEVVDENASRRPYQFSILVQGDTDAGQAEKLLKAKIKKGVDKRYLKKGKKGKSSIGKDWKLGGRIEWSDDLATEFHQVLIIDGKPITIEEFAEMLRSFEGFDFKFSIHDPSDGYLD